MSWKVWAGVVAAALLGTIIAQLALRYLGL